MGWFYHMGFSSKSYFLLFIFVWFIMWPFTHGNIIIFIEFVSQEHIIFGIACNQNDNGTLLDNLKLYHVLLKQVQLGSNLATNYWKTITWLIVQRICWHVYFFTITYVFGMQLYIFQVSMFIAPKRRILQPTRGYVSAPYVLIL